MATEYLNRAIEGIPSLRAVIVTAMPDCLLYDSWIQEDSDWSADQVAAYFGDLFRANREGLKALNAWSSDLQVTIEAPEHLIILTELTSDFVFACVFAREAALGMARLHTRRLAERVAASLPSFEVERRPRGVRIVEFLHRYAPDPHAVLLRASLRTGIALESLEKPEALGDEAVQRLEETACDLLGLERLNL